MPMKLKIVKNKGSINIIAKESVYYAEYIKNVRRLKGKIVEY